MKKERKSNIVTPEERQRSVLSCHPLGRDSCSMTMTVHELVENLKQFPPDALALIGVTTAGGRELIGITAVTPFSNKVINVVILEEKPNEANE